MLEPDRTRVYLDLQETQRIALYAKTESIGSIASISLAAILPLLSVLGYWAVVLGFWEVKVGVTVAGLSFLRPCEKEYLETHRT